MFNSSDLKKMRATQENHMMDTCVIQAYSRSISTFGEPNVTYTDGSAKICGLDMRPGIERHNPSNTLVEYDAVVRLPITTLVDPKDRIKITERFGETLAVPLVFEIVSPIQQGPSGIRLLVKKVDV